MTLLKKGSLADDLDIVSEFRPITMTATMGKIFLSIISDRLHNFFVKNNHIQRAVQNGFLFGVKQINLEKVKFSDVRADCIKEWCLQEEDWPATTGNLCVRQPTVILLLLHYYYYSYYYNYYYYY